MKRIIPLTIMALGLTHCGVAYANEGGGNYPPTTAVQRSTTTTVIVPSTPSNNEGLPKTGGNDTSVLWVGIGVGSLGVALAALRGRASHE